MRYIQILKCNYNISMLTPILSYSIVSFAIHLMMGNPVARTVSAGVNRPAQTGAMTLEICLI
jgi:hypothetical protein